MVCTVQSSEILGVIVLERCLVQLDDDADQSLFSFVVGKLNGWLRIIRSCICIRANYKVLTSG